MHDAESLKRFPGLAAGSGKKTVLALGADGPVGGEKSVAAYFVGLSLSLHSLKAG